MRSPIAKYHSENVKRAHEKVQSPARIVPHTEPVTQEKVALSKKNYTKIKNRQRAMRRHFMKFVQEHEQIMQDIREHHEPIARAQPDLMPVRQLIRKVVIASSSKVDYHIVRAEQLLHETNDQTKEAYFIIHAIHKRNNPAYGIAVRLKRRARIRIRRTRFSTPRYRKYTSALTVEPTINPTLELTAGPTFQPTSSAIPTGPRIRQLYLSNGRAERSLIRNVQADRQRVAQQPPFRIYKPSMSQTSHRYKQVRCSSAQRSSLSIRRTIIGRLDIRKYKSSSPRRTARPHFRTYPARSEIPTVPVRRLPSRDQPAHETQPMEVEKSNPRRAARLRRKEELAATVGSWLGGGDDVGKDIGKDGVAKSGLDLLVETAESYRGGRKRWGGRR